MQRERTSLDSFPDLNQGSSPNNATLDDEMANPVENRLIENEEIVAQRSNGWHHGESSYTANNLLQAFRNRSDALEWPSSLDGADPRSEDWPFDPSSLSDTSYLGNQVNNRSINMQNCASSLNVNSNNANLRETDFLRGNTGNSSGSSYTFLGNNDTSSQSFSTWGSSCKRKALEGTPGQFYSGASSSSNQMVDNAMQHPFPGCYTAPGNLSMPSAPLNSSSANLSNGVVTSGVAPSFFPSSSGPRISEGPSRNFTIRSNLAHHEPVPFDALRNDALRSIGIYAAQPLPLPNSTVGSVSAQFPLNPNIPLTQAHIIHAEEPTSIHSYPWNGSRSGSSSRSSRERGPRARDRELINDIRSTFINNISLDYPMNVAASGSDQISWSHASGTTASRPGPSSGGRASSSSWLPHQGPSSQNHHRLLEAAPWILFPNIESDSGIRRSHFELFPNASGSDEAAMNGRTHQQSDQRSAALLMDMPGDNMSSLRALASVESRNRLIRQVLSAVRRGGRLQPEDYVYIDPFLNGFAELHDRHRDLRLDVDNMSYEELLALEEQIGNVNTGVSEDKMKGSMKQRMYEETEISTNLEPCCICQEHYIAGDDIGILDCTHEFHTDCIKKWLILKNLCPICKKTALAT